MKIKKIFTSLLLITLTTFVHATTFNGLYIGAEGGMNAITSKFNRNTIAPNDISVERNYFINSAGTGGGYLGFGKSIHRFYFGTEVTFAENGLLITNVNQSQTFFPVGFLTEINRTQLLHNIGFTIQPGVLFASYGLLYGILGVADGRFNFRDQGSGDSAFINYYRSLNGLRLGLGLSFALNNYLSLRFAYAYTLYTPFDDSMIGANGLQETFYHRIRTHQMLMGLSLFFT